MSVLKVLLISHSFAPSAEVGAKRATGVALELQNQGNQPYVLTMSESCILKVDPSRRRKELDGIPTLRTSCRSLWHHSDKWRSATNPINKAVLLSGKLASRMLDSFKDPDIFLPWARGAIKAGTNLIKKETIDLIWSTSPNLANHFLATELSERTSVPFVADFRDLLNPESKAGNTSPLLELENRVLKKCVGITYVAPPQIRSLESRYDFVARKPSRLIYNFFQPDKVAASYSKWDVPTIIYGGSLYRGQRRTSGLIRALAKLESPVRWKFYGNAPDQEIIRSDSTFEQVRAKIELDDPIQQIEFEEHCQRSSIQVLIVGHGREHEETIPGKLYDYFRSGTPILVLGPANCLAAQLTESINRGIGATDDQPAEIAMAVENLLNGMNRLNKPLDLSEEAVGKFTQVEVVRQLANFFEQVLG